jgi:hypothetical protein
MVFGMIVILWALGQHTVTQIGHEVMELRDVAHVVELSRVSIFHEQGLDDVLAATVEKLGVLDGVSGHPVPTRPTHLRSDTCPWACKVALRNVETATLRRISTTTVLAA